MTTVERPSSFDGDCANCRWPHHPDDGPICKNCNQPWAASVPPEPPTLNDEPYESRLREIAKIAAETCHCRDGHPAVSRSAVLWLVGEVRALRAKVAALKSDEERLDWLEKWLPEQPGHRRLVFDRSVPEFTLFQSDDNVRRLGMKKTLRAAIDAARSASGEDVSHNPDTGQTP